MALKRNHPASKLNPETKDFVFVDHHILSLNCERLLNPASVITGKYSTDVNAQFGFQNFERGEIGDPKLRIKFNIAIEGYRKLVVDGKKSKAKGLNTEDKAFRIQLTMESVFRYRREGKLNPNLMTNDTVNSLVAQVYPLALIEVKGIAQKMGFTRFSPDLGLEVDGDEKIERKKD